MLVSHRLSLAHDSIDAGEHVEEGHTARIAVHMKVNPRPRGQEIAVLSAVESARSWPAPLRTQDKPVDSGVQIGTAQTMPPKSVDSNSNQIPNRSEPGVNARWCLDR